MTGLRCNYKLLLRCFADLSHMSCVSREEEVGRGVCLQDGYVSERFWFFRGIKFYFSSAIRFVVESFADKRQHACLSEMFLAAVIFQSLRKRLDSRDQNRASSERNERKLQILRLIACLSLSSLCDISVSPEPLHESVHTTQSRAFTFSLERAELSELSFSNRSYARLSLCIITATMKNNRKRKKRGRCQIWRATQTSTVPFHEVNYNISIDKEINNWIFNFASQFHMQ
jgi:hypothetical protein